MEAAHKGLFFFCIILVIFENEKVAGNGRLLLPPQRSSLWREPAYYRHPNVQRNYDDHTLDCGGYWTMHENNGRCGVCGDPWNDPKPRPNEAGGVYARGIIGRIYSTDKRFIDTIIQITSSIGGFFEFRICPNNDVTKPVTQECLDMHQMRIYSTDRSTSYGRRYFTNLREGTSGIVELSVRIPEGLVCSQCVMQWRWHGANNYGICRNGRWGKGCGKQPEILNCADIAVLPENIQRPPEQWPTQEVKPARQVVTDHRKMLVETQTVRPWSLYRPTEPTKADRKESSAKAKTSVSSHSNITDILISDGKNTSSSNNASSITITMVNSTHEATIEMSISEHSNSTANITTLSDQHISNTTGEINRTIAVYQTIEAVSESLPGKNVSTYQTSNSVFTISMQVSTNPNVPAVMSTSPELSLTNNQVSSESITVSDISSASTRSTSTIPPSLNEPLFSDGTTSVTMPLGPSTVKTQSSTTTEELETRNPVPETNVKVTKIKTTPLLHQNKSTPAQTNLTTSPTLAGRSSVVYPTTTMEIPQATTTVFGKPTVTETQEPSTSTRSSVSITTDRATYNDVTQTTTQSIGHGTSTAEPGQREETHEITSESTFSTPSLNAMTKNVDDNTATDISLGPSKETTQATTNVSTSNDIVSAIDLSKKTVEAFEDSTMQNTSKHSSNQDTTTSNHFETKASIGSVSPIASDTVDNFKTDVRENGTSNNVTVNIQPDKNVDSKLNFTEHLIDHSTNNARVVTGNDESIAFNENMTGTLTGTLTDPFDISEGQTMNIRLDTKPISNEETADVKLRNNYDTYNTQIIETTTVGIVTSVATGTAFMFDPMKKPQQSKENEMNEQSEPADQKAISNRIGSTTHSNGGQTTTSTSQAMSDGYQTTSGASRSQSTNRNLNQETTTRNIPITWERPVKLRKTTGTNIKTEPRQSAMEGTTLNTIPGKSIDVKLSLFENQDHLNVKSIEPVLPNLNPLSADKAEGVLIDMKANSSINSVSTFTENEPIGQVGNVVSVVGLSAIVNASSPGPIPTVASSTQRNQNIRLLTLSSEQTTTVSASSTQPSSISQSSLLTSPSTPPKPLAAMLSMSTVFTSTSSVPSSAITSSSQRQSTTPSSATPRALPTPSSTPATPMPKNNTSPGFSQPITANTNRNSERIPDKKPDQSGNTQSTTITTTAMRISERVTDKTSERILDTVSERRPENGSTRNTDILSERTPDKVSERVLNKERPRYQTEFPMHDLFGVDFISRRGRKFNDRLRIGRVRPWFS